MDSIGDLLKKHKIPGTELSEIRHGAAAAAQALLKFPVSTKAIKLKGKTLFFTLPSVLKTELMLREADLKRMLKDIGISIDKIK